MKTRLTLLLLCGLLCLESLLATAGHSQEEETRLVARLLEFTMDSPDVLKSGQSYLVPDYSNPDVFYGIRAAPSWTRAEKEQAFWNFVTNMWQLDFSGNDRSAGRPSVVAATLQCLRLNYTNAVPSIRRLMLNPTLRGSARRSVLDWCIQLSPVDDGMTQFMGNVLTNEALFAKDQRYYVLQYADKVYGAMVSNLADRAVCDRAAMMVYKDYPRDDWQRTSRLDRFLSTYYDGYAMSSNRLAFLDGMLSNTNVTENADMVLIKRRFIALTNQLHSADQPLRQLRIGEGGNE